MNYYKENSYNWQTNIDKLFKYAESVIYKKVAEKIPYRSEVLDIGCGLGEFSKYLKESKYIGIDISKKNILLAKSKFPFSKFIVEDATNTKFMDNSFNYIVCIETIEHLTINEIRNLFSEIKRIGTPHCQIIITTPNLYYLWGILPWSFIPIKRRLTIRKFFEGIRRGFVNEHYNIPVCHYRFKPTFLRLLMEEYFKVESLESTYWYNNRAIHEIFTDFQFKILKFSSIYNFAFMGSQLILKALNNKDI